MSESDIVARLKAGEACVEASAGGYANDCKVKDAASGCLCAAAADEIAHLRAEVERLRAALEKIGDHNIHGWTMQTELAHAALEEKPTYTYGHCEHKKAPGGCQLHNLQCGYPDCDRRATLKEKPNAASE